MAFLALHSLKITPKLPKDVQKEVDDLISYTMIGDEAEILYAGEYEASWKTSREDIEKLSAKFKGYTFTLDMTFTDYGCSKEREVFKDGKMIQRFKSRMIMEEVEVDD